jgi:spore germination protein YaaH
MTSARHTRPRPWLLLTALATAVALAPLHPAPAAAADPGINPRANVKSLLSHQVYGYLPYWRLNAGTATQINYDLVSTIAFFGLGIKATGDIDMAWRGTTAYLSADAAAVTNAAHAKGVRVVPTFQLFDSGSLLKLTAFLGSAAAQDRFIAQALNLMERRSADGANFDFEPMPAAQTPQYLAFLAKFNAAMDARFPGATLVNATSAGAPSTLITGLVPIVDQMFVMTYNYRWTGSTVTGAIAPLDHATRNVKIHMNRFMAYAPREKLILGVPYYGYDWPVTSPVPNATVQADKTKYGAVTSVTYASARAFLAAHPEVIRQYDALEGSAFYSYWNAAKGTWRQVYFEDEQSAAAKYEYAISTGFAGVGIWTLGNDAGYQEMWNALRVFFDPKHDVGVGASVSDVARRSGTVYATLYYRLVNSGDITERGTLRWQARDPRGRPVAQGTIGVLSVGVGKSAASGLRIQLGRAAQLPAGTWRMTVYFVTADHSFESPAMRFRQPF